MTTFSYTLALNNIEGVLLSNVLDLAAEQCENAIANNQQGHYIGRLESINRIRNKLYNNARQTSGNSIDPVTGEFTIWINSYVEQSELSTTSEGMNSLLKEVEDMADFHNVDVLDILRVLVRQQTDRLKDSENIAPDA
ncbi:MAG: hypothetical protein NT123_06830 [Proteobacteria bacterium]|nr:hypothetical protein [Pseudomonadota bacterium]